MVSPYKSQVRVGLPWEGVCAALGIPLPSRALPLRTRCPSCRQFALDLYHDNTVGGQWHHCTHCGIAGDMLDLVCKVWDMSPDAALRKLAAGGLTIPKVDEISLALINSTGQRRANLLELWERARHYYPQCKSQDMALIRRHYGLIFQMSPDRWRDGPSRLLGALPHTHITASWTPSPDSYHIFKGGQWSEVLMTPYFSMPGRIQAFAFLGRDGRRPDDEIFRTVPGPRGTTKHREAGLAGIEILPYADPSTDVVAVDDHMLMLHLQIRTLRISLTPMPMVAWRDDGVVRTTGAWSMLNNKRIIFWTMNLDARVLRQAVECDGFLSLAGPEALTPQAINHYYRAHPGTDMLRIIRLKARPWVQTLGAWLAASGEGQRETLWASLERSGADVSYILRKLGSAAPLGLQNRPSPRVREVRLGKSTIVEEGDRWYLKHVKGRRREISNTVLRLTHAIKDRDSGELFYHGVLRHRGDEIPFVAPVDTIHKHTAQWITDKLVDNAVGILVTDPFFARRLHQIAVMFCEPEFVIDDLYRWVHRLPEESPGQRRKVISRVVLPALPSPQVDQDDRPT